MSLLPEIYFSPYDMRQIQTFGYFLGSILSMFMLGRIAHESTHWLVAWLFGADVENVSLGWLSGHVTYTMAESKPLYYDRIINLSPQLIGIFVGVPVLAWLYQSGLSVIGVYVAIVAWFAYTLLGGAADYSMAVARGEGQLWTPNVDETVSFISLAMVLLGVLTMFLDPTGEGIVVDYAEHLDIAMTFGGITLIFSWMFIQNRQSIA